jgi:hypothetical protein
VKALLALALVPLLTATAYAAPGETNVADCEQTAGGAVPNWRSASDVAGPLGVLDNTLQHASRTHNRQFLAKMPLVVEGNRTVTLSVPPPLRNRVFLYYGRVIGRNGQPTTSFSQSAGYSETEFRPCDRRVSAWPGGMRVRGTGPVHLTVTVEGRPGSIPLRLGRPKVPATKSTG